LPRSHIFWRHFKALFIKRFHNFKRDGKAALWTLLYPGIILLAGLLALQFAVNVESPRRVMSATIYEPWNPQIIIGNPTSTSSDIVTLHDAIDTIAPDYGQTHSRPTMNNTIPGLQQWLLDEYNQRKFNQGRFGAYLITEATNIPTTDPTSSFPHDVHPRQQHRTRCTAGLCKLP
jgi:hypothetical protein